jgi:DNA-binding NarL/FixJ family response regulator
MLQPRGTATSATSRMLADLGRTDAAAKPPRAAASGAAVTALTPRERDVLTLVAQGLSNTDIAARLALSKHTVHRHLANILRKLGLSSRAAAAACGVRTGVV